MNAELIEAEYRKITSETLSSWAGAQGVGKFVGLPAGYDKLGICIGSFYEPPNALVQFLDLLEQIASVDSALTLVPRTNMHFTFLALAGHYWDETSELPTETKELVPLVQRRLGTLSWQLKRLRLVPGKNHLLLAGVPDERSHEARELLARDLMSSSWKKYVEQRYTHKGFPFPPVVWHTTLCRYQNEYLSGALRALFHQYEGEDFGSVDLGTPALRAINYDWSTAIPLPEAQLRHAR